MEEKTYAIRVEDTIGKTVLVKAQSLEDAKNTVENALLSDKLMLNDVDDFCERYIGPSALFSEGLVTDEDVSYYERLNF